jgi:hypothetical protein
LLEGDNVSEGAQTTEEEVLRHLIRVAEEEGVSLPKLRYKTFIAAMLGAISERQIRKFGDWPELKVRAFQLHDTGEAPPEPPPPSHLELHRLRGQLKSLRKKNANLLQQLDTAEKRVEFIADLQGQTLRSENLAASAIVKREKTPTGLREATAVALASDWHIEEYVDPATVDELNAYDLSIAEKRAQKFFCGIVWLLKDHATSFKIRDLILWLGGDIITGYIHEELEEANALSPTLATRFARQLIVWGLKHLMAETDIETIHVLCNHGNHGRLHKKRRVSTAAANSFEHLLYHMIAQDFEDEPRVKFTIAQGAHLYYQVYDFTTRWHHGDDVRYHGGVGGVFIPLNKAVDRWQSTRWAHITNIGHFHQYLSLPDKVCNGSLIGFSPYALSVKARYEPPRQAFYLIDARRGKCQSTPIWVAENPPRFRDDPRNPQRSEVIRRQMHSNIQAE